MSDDDKDRELISNALFWVMMFKIICAVCCMVIAVQAEGAWKLLAFLPSAGLLSSFSASNRENKKS